VSGVESPLAIQARRRPGRPAIEWRGRPIPYAELDGRVRALALRLRTAGVAPGDRIAVVHRNEPLVAELLHAAIALEAVLVPLDPRLTAEELRERFEDMRPRIAVAGDDLAGIAREAARDLLAIRVHAHHELAALEPAPGALATHLDSAQDRLLLFTSGTTGRAKAVRLAWENLQASAMASAERLGSREDDRWLACLPLHHIGGLSILVRSAIHGSTAVLHERFDADRVLHALARERIHLVSLVPTQLRRLLEPADPAAARLDAAPPALRVVLLGGGPIPPDLVARCLERRIPVSPTYGLTEAASQVTTLAPEELALAPGSAGRPLAGTRVRIVDDTGRDLPANEPGEILVHGPQVMRGYLDRPDETARALAGGWLHTGDIGFLDARGDLHIHDRRSDLIVTGGENVYPAEVEAALLAHPDVAEACAVARPDPEWGQAVHVVIVSRVGSRPSLESLRESARARIAGFKLPRSVSYADALPRTAAGKLRREKVRRELFGDTAT
jgi:O-succinylbenzoic acid--CoA ligase